MSLLSTWTPGCGWGVCQGREDWGPPEAEEVQKGGEPCLMSAGLLAPAWFPACPLFSCPPSPLPWISPSSVSCPPSSPSRAFFQVYFMWQSSRSNPSKASVRGTRVPYLHSGWTGHWPGVAAECLEHGHWNWETPFILINLNLRADNWFSYLENFMLEQLEYVYMLFFWVF